MRHKRSGPIPKAPVVDTLETATGAATATVEAGGDGEGVRRRRPRHRRRSRRRNQEGGGVAGEGRKGREGAVEVGGKAEKENEKKKIWGDRSLHSMRFPGGCLHQWTATRVNHWLDRHSWPSRVNHGNGAHKSYSQCERFEGSE